MSNCRNLFIFIVDIKTGRGLDTAVKCEHY